MSDEIKITDKRGQTKSDSRTEPTAHVHGENCNHNHGHANDQGSAASNEISFSSLIISLGTSAMIHLGVMEDPNTKKIEKHVELAREEIDLISMLQEKTKGNLTDQEAKVTEQVLYELRVKFVETTKS